MSIRAHEFGRFSSRPGKNVFTLSDLNKEKMEKPPTPPIKVSRVDPAAPSKKSSSVQSSRPTICAVIAVVLGILAMLLPIALLLTRVETGAALVILAAVFLTVILIISICYCIYLYYNASIVDVINL